MQLYSTQCTVTYMYNTKALLAHTLLLLLLESAYEYYFASPKQAGFASSSPKEGGGFFPDFFPHHLNSKHLSPIPSTVLHLRQDWCSTVLLLRQDWRSTVLLLLQDCYHVLRSVRQPVIVKVSCSLWWLSLQGKMLF